MTIMSVVVVFLIYFGVKKLGVPKGFNFWMTYILLFAF